MSKKEKQEQATDQTQETVTAEANGAEKSQQETVNQQEETTGAATDKTVEGQEAQADEKDCEKTVQEDLGEKLAAINDKYLRLSAEFDNYRKRTLKERADLLKSAGEDIFTGLLPVVDNFERALKSVEGATDIEAVKEGINLIYTNFKEFLNQRNVKEIEAQGNEFDLDLHEALTKIPAPSDDLKGKVVDVIEKGYKLSDKVIRYSKVVVGE